MISRKHIALNDREDRGQLGDHHQLAHALRQIHQANKSAGVPGLCEIHDQFAEAHRIDINFRQIENNPAVVAANNGTHGIAERGHLPESKGAVRLNHGNVTAKREERGFESWHIQDNMPLRRRLQHFSPWLL